MPAITESLMKILILKFLMFLKTIYAPTLSKKGVLNNGASPSSNRPIVLFFLMTVIPRAIIKRESRVGQIK